MSAKLLSVDQNGDICEDVPTAQPVEIEENITRVACELDAAVSCASHFVKICTVRNSAETSLKQMGQTLSKMCKYL